MASRAVSALLLSSLLLGGCMTRAADPGWGPRLSAAAELRAAAVDAARSPATWMPLTAAAALALTDTDDDLSRWAADETPLFGGDAESASDDLRMAANVAYGLTALLAPSRGPGRKAGGLLVGAVTLGLENAITDAVKNVSDRERPDGSNDESFTSGHAGRSSAASTLARRNLDYMALPGWLDTGARVALQGVAAATGWARVEAERHHVTDVLAGYALGHFVAAFMHRAFMASPAAPLRVTFQPRPRGGAWTVTVPLGR